MTGENKMADTPQEGEINFTSEVNGDKTSTDSPTENNDTEETQSADGEDENNQQDTDGEDDGNDAGDDSDKTPFHKHPRWTERETEWDERFNNQETRHQDDIKKMREEFGKKPKADTESQPIPSWFGGDQAQWNDYQTDLAKQISKAEENAIEKFNGTKTAEDKAVQDATDYMKSEITIIEADKSLNPSGNKIDPNKLLKIVMDNELIDSKGRWNYKAGVKIMNAQVTKPAETNNKKKIAGATTSESTGETTPKNFKTTQDFIQKRPW